MGNKTDPSSRQIPKTKTLLGIGVVALLSATSGCLPVLGAGPMTVDNCIETFSVDQAARPTGPSNRAFMVEPDTLLAEFADWRIRYFEDRVVDGEALVRMIAQKRA